MRSLTLARPHRRSHGRHRGFTFMEILFAVMILGIGFIMVAAMFPAALRQTQANVEENEFNAVAHIAAQQLQNLADNTDPRWAAFAKGQQQANVPVTGQPSRLLDLLTGWLVNENDNVWPLEWDPAAGTGTINSQWGRPIPWSFHDPRFGINGNYGALATVPPVGVTGTTGSDPNMQPTFALWDLVRGNVIVPEKKQNAWGALWSRSQRTVNGKRVAGPSLQLFIFPLHSRAKAEYDPNPYVLGSNPMANNPSCDITYGQANLDPALITFHYYPPPKSAASSNAPNGVFQLFEICTGPGGNFPKPYNVAGGSGASTNPLAEGAYVVVSDDQHHIVANMPAKYNGMIFKLGPEVADQNGTIGTSAGQYWSVAEVINIPSELPFGIADPSSIEPSAFSTGGLGSAPHALVFGRQIDPADPSQTSDSAHASLNQQQTAPNRIGTAQELGYYPWSVIVQQ